MDFNSFVFPVPEASYTKDDYPELLIYIPKKIYSYKDKLKYNMQENQIKNNNKDRKILLNTNKTNSHNKNTSMIQRVPSVTFTLDNKFEDSKNSSSENILEYIPCLFYKSETANEKIILYFHSNYEDIGNSAPLLNLMSKCLNINILAVEYPNYGIYKSKSDATAETILADAETVFKFINEVKDINENNIIIMGRCVGSGPSTYLASTHSVQALILLSPFKSIKEAIRTMFPKLNLGSFIQSIVKERFNNMENINKVTSPILFIHGKNDTLIPPSHSYDLINKCKSPAKLVSPNNMTHNTFDYIQDVVIHVRNFLKVFTNYTNSIYKKKEEEVDDTDENIIEKKEISFPKFMYNCPFQNNK